MDAHQIRSTELFLRRRGEKHRRVGDAECESYFDAARACLELLLLREWLGISEDAPSVNQNDVKEST